MYRSTSAFSGGLFNEFDRLQQELYSALGSLGLANSIRSASRNTFPQINIGSTSKSIEVYAFAPGIDPDKLDTTIDQGLLTISGEREATPDAQREEGGRYASERFFGKFKRVINLPEDADPTQVEARYQDGVLRISVARREAPQPQRIQVK
ncbi:MAG: Hsp20/alpha crystallin family protein [Pseudomonadota bacterium]